MRSMIESVLVIASLHNDLFEIIHHPVKSMSSFNQNGQTASAVPASYQSASIMNDPATLETLLPKNLSSNKRAVIERLIALHRQNGNRG